MIRALINLYLILLIVDFILSFLPQYRSQPWALWVKKAADLTCRPVRQALPPDLPYDFSYIIVFMGLNLFVALF
jgi:YggT family protein